MTMPVSLLGRLLLAFAIGGALLLSGCSSSKSEASKPADLVDFKQTLNVRTAWRVNVGDAKGAPLQPAVLDNAVYAAGRQRHAAAGCAGHRRSGLAHRHGRATDGRRRK
jgi:hypothetical protein